MKTMQLVLFLLICFSITGCAKPLYRWSNYSNSLYKLKKEPSEENIKKHKEVLLEIIDDSIKNGVQVPPGVYCEYGYILLKEGKKDDALKYFDLEEKIYPESKTLILKLKSSIKK